ncbi:nicotinate phosphoribosyltransferase pncB2 [bacterium BMS3Abin02]|nr:nicotinate phosphoribosyltransferase pncB2 [bacterium BMS3Abin02]
MVMNADQRAIAEGFLFTDLYQLTMAQVYYRLGVHEQAAEFDHYFRSYPDYGKHQAGYAVNAGLEWLLDWMQETHVRDADVDYLRTLTGAAGKRLFADDFLRWLRTNGDFSGLSVTAIPEGRIVHRNVPITMIVGPLAMAQVLETSLLNRLNYPTLIATKASRVHEAGRGRPVLEFGMRRGPERGTDAGTRAALIGGADFSSNVGASAVLGVPAKGTHAHSLIQLFLAKGGGEIDAFRAYAEVFPDDCLLLVDTIDTIESGIPNAIAVFEELRRKGHEPLGIRLDSGDLAYLAIQAAAMLNAAGFPDASIVLSSNLDELAIWQIVSQIEGEAPRYGVDADRLINRLSYGVGTRLITSQGDASLDGVYKLVAIEEQGKWMPAIKVSESQAKIPNPGRKQVWRLYDRRGTATADVLGTVDERLSTDEPFTLHHPVIPTAVRRLEAGVISEVEVLPIPAVREGRRVSEPASMEELRRRRIADLDRLDPGVRRLINPHVYHVSLTEAMWNLKVGLVRSLRA